MENDLTNKRCRYRVFPVALAVHFVTGRLISELNALKNTNLSFFRGFSARVSGWLI